MSNALYQPLGASELLPRYAFLESLIAGARILEVGAVASTWGRSAAFLRERGARSVLAIDSNADRVARAQRDYASDAELKFRAAPARDVADGGFDLVLVADAAAAMADPLELSALVRAAGTGRLVLGLRNLAGVSLAQLAGPEPREGRTWGELAAALAGRFASVEVFAQTALFGYRIGPARESASIETGLEEGLAPREDCAYHLAVCGARPAKLGQAQLLVPLPAAPLAVAAEGRAAPGREALGGNEVLPEREARRRIEELEAKSALLAGQLREARDDLAREKARAGAAEERAAGAAHTLELREERLFALEKDLFERTRDLETARGALERKSRGDYQVFEERDQLRARTDELERSLSAAAAEASQAKAALAEATARARHVEDQAAAADRATRIRDERLAAVEKQLEGERERLAAAQAALERERGGGAGSTWGAQLEEQRARIAELEEELGKVRQHYRQTDLELEEEHQRAQQIAQVADKSLAEASDVRQELSDLSAALSDARAELSEAAAREALSAAALKDFQGRATRSEQRVTELEGRLRAAQERAGELEKAWIAAQRTLGEARHRITQLEAAARKSQPPPTRST